jgi:hypothetical protein
MSPIREVFLSLNDVDEQIAAFERKYGLSSGEFFRDEEVREQISEDDVFHWDALIYHRLALRESYQEVHSGYLATLSQSTGEVRPDKEHQKELLAA